MWITISQILIKIVMALLSDRVLVEAGKKMLNKAVESAEDSVGIDNEDAREIIESITKSSLNSVDESITKHFVG